MAEKRQSNAEKEFMSGMMKFLKGRMKAYEKAFVHDNDRFIIMHEMKFIKYCGEVKYIKGLTPKQIKLIETTERDCFRIIRGLQKKEQREVDKHNKQIDETIEKLDSCFIATATMGNRNHPKVVTLREFRDKILLSTIIGNSFINYYYKIGPGIANFIQNKIFLRKLSYLFIVSPMSIMAGVMLLNRKRRSNKFGNTIMS